MKTADISRRHHWFPSEMRSEERGQKFHTDDVSLVRSGYGASDWLKQISPAARPIRSATQIWVVPRHQCGISALVLRTLFFGESSDSVANFGRFSVTVVL